MEVDASNYAKGAVLYQKQDDMFKTIAYMLTTMLLAKWNYDVADKELSAIMMALTHWHYHLMGATKDFEI
jgi:RNase H-like domain found in reverse transcriptase